MKKKKIIKAVILIISVFVLLFCILRIWSYISAETKYRNVQYTKSDLIETARIIHTSPKQTYNELYVNYEGNLPLKNWVVPEFTISANGRTEKIYDGHNSTALLTSHNEDGAFFDVRTNSPITVSGLVKPARVFLNDRYDNSTLHVEVPAKSSVTMDINKSGENNISVNVSKPAKVSVEYLFPNKDQDSSIGILGVGAASVEIYGKVKKTMYSKNTGKGIEFTGIKNISVGVYYGEMSVIKAFNNVNYNDKYLIKVYKRNI